jgi:CheY-like chemotaxis protein
MAPQRTLLIAEPDLNAVRPLAKALRTHGYHVHYVRDGAKALELAVLRLPDLILYDEHCPLIDVRSFVQILETNPRTAGLPVIVSTTGGSGLGGLRVEVVQKPFELDEVLSRVEYLCRRMETARQLKGEARPIEGGLEQLPLPDLLQILAVNHRTGRLLLTHGALRGELALAMGMPVNARLGRVEGEKALFRLLGWSEGTFEFHPGPAPERALISRTIEDALMEGMRQNDERARLLAGLPRGDRPLLCTAGAQALIEPHASTAQLLELLRQPRHLDELLDLASAPDLEVLGAVRSLLEKGLVRIAEVAPREPRALLGSAELHTLQGRLMRGAPARHARVAKIAVCGTGARAAKWLLASAPGLVPTSAEPRAVRSGFGTLGRIELGELVWLDFLLVPSGDLARPLWRPFLSSALGALVLEDSGPVLGAARFCGFELRLPLVVLAGHSGGEAVSTTVVPPQLRGAPGGVVAMRADLPAAMRALLLIALKSSGPTTRARSLEGPG